MDKIAVVLLSCHDFESLEISLAAHTKFLTNDIKIYILQNGFGTYDTERTYRVAKRYKDLFPKNIEVVDWIKPQKPYEAIQQLLNSDIMKKYDYICKVDDDVFPLTDDWLDKLYKTFKKEENNNLAYVTSLVNNNPWGFIETLKCMNLEDEYLLKIAREHLIIDNIIPANVIMDGWCGTIWNNPYISRWLHYNTTCKPDEYINSTKGLKNKAVNNNARYSINCMFFKREFWNLIENYGVENSSDEHKCFEYCKQSNKQIISCLSVPMVHLFFYSQREENKDIILKVREVYQNWLNINYPISICPNKEYENENRLRFLEKLILEVKK